VDEEVLHDVGPEVIQPYDQFYIQGQHEVPSRATALTHCSILTNPDGTQRCVFMVEVPTDHIFDNLMRPKA